MSVDEKVAVESLSDAGAVPANDDLADDLLNGLEEISQFIGSKRWPKWRVQYYHDTKQLPIFGIGRRVFARKSELRKALSGKDWKPPSKSEKAKPSPWPRKRRRSR